jgi:hypothetical protein
MTRTLAFLLGVAVSIGVWIAAPVAKPELAQVWFTGAGAWQGMLLHGRDIVGAASGLIVWIAALHVPRRGKVIAGIRIGARARAQTEAAATG